MLKGRKTRLHFSPVVRRLHPVVRPTSPAPSTARPRPPPRFARPSAISKIHGPCTSQYVSITELPSASSTSIRAQGDRRFHPPYLGLLWHILISALCCCSCLRRRGALLSARSRHRCLLSQDSGGRRHHDRVHLRVQIRFLLRHMAQIRLLLRCRGHLTSTPTMTCWGSSALHPLPLQPPPQESSSLWEFDEDPSPSAVAHDLSHRHLGPPA